MVAACAVLSSCSGDDGEELVVYSSATLPSASNDVRAEQLALSEAGGRAGDFKVKLVSLNNVEPEIEFADPKRAAGNARKAVADDRAIAYIGEGPTAATVASLPILNRAGMLMVTPTSSYVGVPARGEARLARLRTTESARFTR